MSEEGAHRAKERSAPEEAPDARFERNRRTSLSAFTEDAVGANDLLRHVPIAIDDEGREIAVGIVLDALRADDRDEFRAREFCSEGGEDRAETS